jgi:hypothetical protein
MFERIAGEIWKAYHLASSNFPNTLGKCIPELQADEKSRQKKK